MDGAALLDELARIYRRFVSLPDGGAEALALWVVFTYALEAFDVAPILALCSPLKRCGKTTTEEVTTALVQRPLAAANVTVAALYRTVEQFAPTLIVDEADTFLLTNLVLRGILNSGHTRATAFVVRIAGQEPRLFSTWGARMIALIGRLPATLEDRAIVLPMRRRAPGEAVDRMRRDGLLRQGDPLSPNRNKSVMKSIKLSRRQRRSRWPCYLGKWPDLMEIHAPRPRPVMSIHHGASALTLCKHLENELPDSDEGSSGNNRVRTRQQVRGRAFRPTSMTFFAVADPYAYA